MTITIANKPMRNRVTRVETAEVQGPGSYILVKKATVNEAQALRLIQTMRPPRVDHLGEAEALEELERFTAIQEQQARDALATFILEWNWVDDEGVPLPLPSEDPNVLGDLTTEELGLIYLTLSGTDSQKKPVTKKL